MNYRMMFRVAVVTTTAMLLTLGVGREARADVEYDITVDTSAVKGVTGYIDFQCNPDTTGSLGVDAALLGFKSDIQGLGSATNTGDVTGGLFPLNTTIHNTNAWNGVTENAVFGKTMTFRVAFSGQALSHPVETGGGTLFALGLLNKDQMSPLFSTRSDGMILRIYIQKNGKLTVDTDAGGVSYVNVRPVPHIISPPKPTRKGIGTPVPHPRH